METKLKDRESNQEEKEESGISQEEAVKKYHNKYKDSTKNLEKLIVKDGVIKMGWNKALFVPLDGIVFVHPDQNGVDKDFIRIIHSKFNIICIFAEHHFTEQG